MQWKKYFPSALSKELNCARNKENRKSVRKQLISHLENTSENFFDPTKNEKKCKNFLSFENSCENYLHYLICKWPTLRENISIIASVYLDQTAPSAVLLQIMKCLSYFADAFQQFFDSTEIMGKVCKLRSEQHILIMRISFLRNPSSTTRMGVCDSVTPRGDSAVVTPWLHCALARCSCTSAFVRKWE